jgi:dipeptidyl aminopeptidase/acylaminoacyl peptidase
VNELSLQGVIDRNRVGFMGHSWAGFWVQFAGSHSNLFRALELHNGGSTTEPGAYGLWGNKAFREYQDHYMGGDPYSPRYFDNYRGFSAAMTADNVRAPVLIESDSQTSIFEMEYYSALRESGVPVDFYIYPNDGHVFTQPEHLMASMKRDLDWFEYWLVNREHGEQVDPGQYERWRGYRANLEKLSHRKQLFWQAH